MTSAAKQQLYALLRWTERYTKTDMVYFASGGGWSALGTVVSTLLALATAVAFANLLPKATYGTYQYILATVGILGIFGLSGIKTAIGYASARNKDQSFFDAIQAKIRWAFLSSAVSLGVGVYYFLQGNSLLGSAFIITAVFLPWWDVYGNYVPYLQGKKRFDKLSLYENGTQCINALAIVGTLLFTKNLLILLLAYFISWTAGRYFFYRRTLAVEPPNQERDPSLLSYGKHLSVMNIINVVASNADKFLLWHFLGAAQVAVYIFSLAIPLRAASTFSAINRLYFPKVAQQKFNDISKTLFRKIFLLTLVTLTTTISYIVLAPYLFDIFFPQYLEAVPYTQIAALLIAAQPFSLLGTALSAHAKKKELYIYNIIPPIVQILSLLVLVPSLHILGAVIALLIGQMTESLLLTGIFIRARWKSGL